ncbi:DNA-binding response regulator [Hanamia caeni]|jgi:DNA-binding NarL/FixJ family response regulator|uniref:DNA-binding response regulator n=1 Tax=Hanamia caeni TaxID=2294116 RepID=A0A3M9N214_9BACT|nr:response regulator transcription factor [Hanamia caeni]RNI31839.1 DNA-binding response regulator [Hanamia caeni]
MISVVIIEDLEDYRNGLVNLINWTEGYECAGAYATAEEAISALAAVHPDVALIDIRLPGKSGIDLVELIHKNFPSILCMMCTAYDEDEKVFKALKAGAYGYLLKSTPPAEILDSIQQLVNGGSPMSSDVARKVIASFQLPEQNSDTENLTAREKQVLTLLSKGLLYKEIAAQLSISIDTVKRHCFNIYEKLHVSNRTEAINKFYRH